MLCYITNIESDTITFRFFDYHNSCYGERQVGKEFVTGDSIKIDNYYEVDDNPDDCFLVFFNCTKDIKQYIVAGISNCVVKFVNGDDLYVSYLNRDKDCNSVEQPFVTAEDISDCLKYTTNNNKVLSVCCYGNLPVALKINDGIYQRNSFVGQISSISSDSVNVTKVSKSGTTDMLIPLSDFHLDRDVNTCLNFYVRINKIKNNFYVELLYNITIKHVVGVFKDNIILLSDGTHYDIGPSASKLLLNMFSYMTVSDTVICNVAFDVAFNFKRRANLNLRCKYDLVYDYYFHHNMNLLASHPILRFNDVMSIKDLLLSKFQCDNEFICNYFAELFFNSKTSESPEEFIYNLLLRVPLVVERLKSRKISIDVESTDLVSAFNLTQ